MLKISKPNITENDIREVVRVIESGELVQGQVCAQFEEELSSYLAQGLFEKPQVALVSSGTAALHLALLSLNISTGDRVLVPNFTFPATINAVHLVGAQPVIIDVCPRRYVVTPDIFAAALDELISLHGEAPRALLLVHEFGCPVEMDVILKIAERHGVYVIEDAACALGASYMGQKVGALGHVGCFSFHPRKTLTTGEGGLVVSRNPQIIERVRSLRSHGMLSRDGVVDFIEPGFNYRMTNFQAALGRLQLQNLDSWILRRRELAHKYCGLIEKSSIASFISLPVLVEGHSWQTFMIVVSGVVVADLIIRLRALGVETNIGAQVLTSIKYVKDHESHYVFDLDRPMSSRQLTGCTMALPLCEQYSDREIEHVVRCLEHVFFELKA